MKREQLIFACCSDLAGKVRGKAFPATELEARLSRGVGWAPTNVQITCFDTIAETPFGSIGDVLLLPDAATRTRIEVDDAETAEEFILCDIRNMDGSAWDFCTRSFLKAALQRLETVAALTLVGAFEQEFQLIDRTARPGEAFSLGGFRTARAFGEALVAALRQARLTPDSFLKEYGANQFELTLAPQAGMAIADHAVIAREVTRAVAAALGRHVTFTPIRDPSSVGNGVHIHLSFRDGRGRPAAYDPSGEHGLSAAAGQFIAGILKYAENIVAMTAPSAVSYLRLTPHRWSAAFNNLALQDREASVRICPISATSDLDAAEQFNFEFRAADAAASPYLQLAILVHAGVQGIEEKLPAPQATKGDLSLLDKAALAARGIVRLPQTLEEALDRFSASDVVRGWGPAGFADLYVKHKQGELAFLRGRDAAAMCRAYEDVY
jgi:glutamine synthetase